MQSARDREVRAVRRRLEELLAEGSLDTFQTLLEEQAAEVLLEDLRERKLVLRTRPEDRPRVRASLASVARRCLAAHEADAYLGALDLMPLLTERMGAMRRALASTIQRLPPMELKDLLSIADKAMREIFREMVDFVGPWSDPERTIAAAEREWHDANWVASDMISAICRAVNEVARAARPARRLRPERRAAAVRVLKTITAYGS